MGLRLLFLSAISFSLFSCQQNTAGDGPIRLSLNSQTFTPESIREFVNNTRISRENALSSLQAMKVSFRESYIGYELKKQLIGKSGDEIFAECERVYNLKFDENPDGIYSHEYIDLNKICISLFKDSHLDVSSQGNQPLVVTGIGRMYRFGNKYHITAIRPNLLKKFEEIGSLPADSLVNAIKLGDEILEIDGQSPAEALQQVRPLVSASSPSFELLNATLTFFNRTSAYPRNGKLAIKIKNMSGQIANIEMPWVQITRGAFDTSTSLYDRQIYLLENSELSTSTETTNGTVTTRTTVTTEENLFRTESLLTQPEIFSQMSGTKTYFSDNRGRREAITHALVTHNSKVACYLRIDTFKLERESGIENAVYERSGTTYVAQDAVALVKSFLETCEANSNKLIVDLRNNPGGNLYYGVQIYELVANRNNVSASLALSYLKRNGNTNFISQILSGFNPASPTANHQLILSALQRDSNSTYGASDWIIWQKKNVMAVFNQPLIVLITPNCISTCDFFAHQIKNSRRGQIIGRDTNGAGFGFIAASAADTEFRDTLNYFKIKIPNQAFSTTSGTSSDIIEDTETRGFTLPFSQVPLIENRPVQPDINLDFTLKDYTDGYSDYLQVIERFM